MVRSIEPARHLMTTNNVRKFEATTIWTWVSDYYAIGHRWCRRTSWLWCWAKPRWPPCRPASDHRCLVLWPTEWRTCRTNWRWQPASPLDSAATPGSQSNRTGKEMKENRWIRRRRKKKRKQNNIRRKRNPFFLVEINRFISGGLTLSTEIFGRFWSIFHSRRM